MKEEIPLHRMWVPNFFSPSTFLFVPLYLFLIYILFCFPFFLCLHSLAYRNHPPLQGYPFQVGYCESTDDQSQRTVPQYTLYLVANSEKERYDWIRAIRQGKDSDFFFFFERKWFFDVIWDLKFNQEATYVALLKEVFWSSYEILIFLKTKRKKEKNKILWLFWIF